MTLAAALGLMKNQPIPPSWASCSAPCRAPRPWPRRLAAKRKGGGLLGG